MNACSWESQKIWLIGPSKLRNVANKSEIPVFNRTLVVKQAYWVWLLLRGIILSWGLWSNLTAWSLQFLISSNAWLSAHITKAGNSFSFRGELKMLWYVNRPPLSVLHSDCQIVLLSVLKSLISTPQSWIIYWRTEDCSLLHYIRQKRRKANPIFSKGYAKLLLMNYKLFLHITRARMILATMVYMFFIDLLLNLIIYYYI